jgi:hypothetical protein
VFLPGVWRIAGVLSRQYRQRASAGLAVFPGNLLQGLFVIAEAYIGNIKRAFGNLIIAFIRVITR